MKINLICTDVAQVMMQNGTKGYQYMFSSEKEPQGAKQFHYADLKIVSIEDLHYKWGEKYSICPSTLVLVSG